MLDKANEEARMLHQENPDGALGLPRAIPLTKPNQDPNGDGLPLLEHYKRCLLEGMGKGAPEQKRLTMVQAVQQKSTGDPRKQLRRFLGMASDCCIWSPNFGLIAKPHCMRR